MVRYWVIAPWNYAQRADFEKVWMYDLENSVISIDCGSAGDFTGLSREEIEARWRLEASRAGLSVRASSYYQGQMESFLFEIQPNDRVIARAGRKQIVGVGTVIGKPYYVDKTQWQEMLGILHDQNDKFLPVRWDDVVPRASPQMLGMRTVYEKDEVFFHQVALEGDWDVTSTTVNPDAPPPRKRNAYLHIPPLMSAAWRLLRRAGARFRG